MKNIIKRIKKNGYSVSGFINKNFGNEMKYTKFNYKVKNGSFNVKEINTITKALNCTIDDLL